MLMMVMMMMFSSPAFSLMALVCLGWSCAHDAVRKPRQILSSGEANPQSNLRPGAASIPGLTPAPTVPSSSSSPSSPSSSPSTPTIVPSTPSLREQPALLELHEARNAAAVSLLPQRRLSSIADNAEDTGVITTSDNPQGESDYPEVFNRLPNLINHLGVHHILFNSSSADLWNEDVSLDIVEISGDPFTRVLVKSGTDGGEKVRRPGVQSVFTFMFSRVGALQQETFHSNFPMSSRSSWSWLVHKGNVMLEQVWISKFK
ncbi:hypothetical protein C0J45_14734 [Silurus meridionalis]|nr:hypothetical protein C0J45_14734 [Silurus meridionalis]